ncbi:hypothetical protein DS909_17415 [Phaeobacter gallaeciensis]|uniref:Transposase n=1 Tax=Phaeobacter gallaeciensis TaxID=60890 RepID=A0A366WRE3_9RHOB|nr:hypothetical protein DS909_17415 [Phaeobacter gallaeciensis]
MSILDEHGREYLTIREKLELNSNEVIEALKGLLIVRDVLASIMSDHGPELIAEAARDWIKAARDKTTYIKAGSPWENENCENFKGPMRNELLNGEIFYLYAKPKSSLKTGGNTPTPDSTHSSGLSPTSA